MSDFARQLAFFSWDSPKNPWLGGGGTLRDRELLQAYAPHLEQVKLYVGAFPGAQREKMGDIEVIPLGFGHVEWISRLSYLIFANLLILILCFQSKSRLGCTLSPYSPFVLAPFHPRHFGILHHTILDSWKSKIGSFWGSVLSACEGYYYTRWQKIAVINDDVAQWLKRNAPKCDVLLSANACDQDLLELQSSNQGEPQILFFGRIDRFMKGIDLLIEAFAQVHPQFPSAKLTIAGRMASEMDRKNTHDFIAQYQMDSHIQVIENPSELQKRELLAGALYFVSPSRFEGWGIAALEACAAGKAVLVSEASGFKSSIAPGGCGILVPIADVPALAKAMLELLENQALRQELEGRSRLWAKQLSWPKIAERELAWILKGKA